MNLLAKLKLTTELDQIANDLQAGDLGLMARITKVRRIDEIIAELTGVQASSDLKDLTHQYATLKGMNETSLDRYALGSLALIYRESWNELLLVRLNAKGSATNDNILVDIKDSALKTLTLADYHRLFDEHVDAEIQAVSAQNQEDKLLDSKIIQSAVDILKTSEFLNEIKEAINSDARISINVLINSAIERTSLEVPKNPDRLGEIKIAIRLAIITAINEQDVQLSVDTLFDVVNKHKSIAVRLRPQFNFDRCVKDYGHSINDQAKTNALLQELRRTTLKDSDASFLRDQLEIDLQGGVYIQKHPQGMHIAKYLTPVDVACWEFIEWVYAQKRLIVGPKALDEATDGDNYPANDQPLPDAEQQAIEANQDFEDEAQTDLVDPPADEAGAFYQAVIDGAEVDEALIQKAIEYAKADESHYLLPEASEVIKNKVIESI